LQLGRKFFAADALQQVMSTDDEKTVSLNQRRLSFAVRRRRRAAGSRIAELFEEHARMVYGVCRLILRDPTEAEDAAQQTFLSAYRALLAGQEPREPSAWLGTIARNECRGRLRSRRVEPLTLVTAASRDETQREVARHEEIEALSAALAELPQQQRDAIVLREFYGLSYAEVAAALGVSGAAVESLLFRSRRRLQEYLRPLRAGLGALALPPTLSEALTRALPGFGGGTAAGTGAVVMAKVGGAPLAAKLAALTLTVGAVGTVAGLQARRHPAPQRPRPVARPTDVRPAKPALAVAQTPVADTVKRSRVSRKSLAHVRPQRESAPAEDKAAPDTGAWSTATRQSEPEHGSTTHAESDRSGGDDAEQTETEPSDTGGSGDRHDSGGDEHEAGD
jgi:RNA polymerase sigma factor (sigma-70 family)